MRCRDLCRRVADRDPGDGQRVLLRADRRIGKLLRELACIVDGGAEEAFASPARKCVSADGEGTKHVDDDDNALGVASALEPRGVNDLHASMLTPRGGRHDIASVIDGPGRESPTFRLRADRRLWIDARGRAATGTRAERARAPKRDPGGADRDRGPPAFRRRVEARRGWRRRDAAHQPGGAAYVSG